MYESILTDNKISSIEDGAININSTLFENNGPINTTDSSVTIPGYGSNNTNTSNNISTPTSLAEQIGTTSVFGSLKVKDSISSDGFVPGISGWRINGLGNVEFNNGKFRGDITGSTGSFTGSISAASGTIGGFTITSTSLYGGIIKTAATVGAGSTGIIMDTAGLRGYDSVLGNTFNLPTNGGAPTFSSGIINSTIFNINTNSVLRTSETVGDGSANSAGILINNTGIYATQANQTLANANVKILTTGSASFSGTINSTSGTIGGFTIGASKLYANSGGIIASDNDTYSLAKMDNNGITLKIATGSQGLTMINGAGTQIGYSAYWGNGTTNHSWGFNSIDDFVINPGSTTGDCIRHSYGNYSPELGNTTYRWGGMWLSSSGSGSYTLNLNTGETAGHTHTVAITMFGRYFTINGETRLWFSV